MKTRGFTLVELITTFALAAVIITILINISVIIRDAYSKSEIKTKLLIEQANLSDALNTKINKKKLTDYSACTDSDFCYNFTFSDGTSEKLIVSNNSIRFGNYTYKLQEGSSVKKPSISKEAVSDTSSDSEFLVIKIPITNKLYSSEDFGINLIYQYKLNYPTQPGILNVIANGYSGVEDGSSHGITVQSSGATIKYAEGINLNSSDIIYSDDTVIEGNTYTFNNVTSGNVLNAFQIQIFDNNGSSYGNFLKNISSFSTVGKNENSYVHEYDTGIYRIRVKANGSTKDSSVMYGNIYLEKGKNYNISYEVVKLTTEQVIAKDIVIRTDYNLDSSPTYKNPGTYTVYYQVSKPGYQTVTGSRNVVIIKVPVSFEADTWETIAANVRIGNTSAYTVGATKEVNLGSTLGTHTLRIANNSTPAECNTEGFSQTACGFVIEFADIITTHNMNSTNTNVGGWRDSAMRAYVNGTIYNSLPTEIKNNIINTYVVSGHGSTSGETNFITTDKLYLLSTKEVWGKEGTSNAINYDTAEAETRQLDYYKNNGVTTSSYSGAIKKYNESATAWWLRSANSNGTNGFYRSNGYGDWHTAIASDTNGVSPTFRIG